MSTASGRPEVVKHRLDLEEDIDLHNRGWKMQRVGLAIIYLVLLAAITGIFGNGWLSKKTAHSRSASVAYERFLRYEAEDEWRFFINNTGRNEATITIPKSYISTFYLDKIVPEPLKTEAINGSYVVTFGGTGDMEIVMTLIPEKPGNMEGTLYVNDEPLTLSHYIYP